MNQEASIFKGINRIFDLEEVTNEVHHTEANTYTFINDFILNYRDQNVEFKALRAPLKTYEKRYNRLKIS
jgi:hypothetical protein